MASFVMAVGIAVVLAPHIGMRGTAIAEAVTLTASAVARLLLVRHFVRIWPFERAFLRLIPPAVAGGLAMWGGAPGARRAEVADRPGRFDPVRDPGLRGRAGGDRAEAEPNAGLLFSLMQRLRGGGRSPSPAA